MILSALLAVGAAALSLPLPQDPPLRLSRAFGDHMVLQRDQPVRIFGTTGKGAAVEVQFAGQTVATTAAADGTFTALLAPMPANATPQELLVRGGGELRLRDVLVGDVWLCSGQSNMAMSLGPCATADELRTAADDGIRYRTWFEHFAASPQADLPPHGQWRPLTKDTAADCTAVGFYFARALRRHVQVPIGLLTCTVGGTEIECWLPPEAVSGYPANAAVGQRLDAALAEYQAALRLELPSVEQWAAAARAAAAAGKPLPDPPQLRRHPNEDREHWHRTHSLYHGMVHPLLPFALAGILWYQGESNGSEGDEYLAKQRALVETWRRGFGRELPFYYVQLTSFGRPSQDPAGGDRSWQYLREAQRQALQLPRTGMAVTFDVGDADDIHPRNKQDVGERLARWALARDYGIAMPVSGPLFARVEADGSRLRVHFTHAEDGLMVGRKDGRAPTAEVPGGELQGFAVAGADRVWQWAKARIDGATVVVECAAVPQPVAVRYAFTMNPTGANLYGKSGLPASPFRSDAW